jgi:branched-chain amino acid transport system permease protein
MSAEADVAGGAHAGTAGTAAERVRRAARWIALVAAVAAVLAWRQDQVGEGSVVVQAVVSGVLLGGIYGLVSMGLTLIFGVLEIVNFAHGALMTLGMYCSYVLAANAGVPVYLTLPLTMLALFVIGAVVHRVVISPAMGQPLENQLLLTLGLAIVIENALLLGFTGTPKNLHTSIGDDSLSILGASAGVTRVIAFGGALALAGALYLLLQRTTLGTTIRAVAANPRGAALVGIDTGRVYTLTFAVGTACVGAAAALVLPFFSLQPTTGETFNILAFVVVVLGGLGNVIGALLGGLIIGLTQEIGGVLFPDQSDLLAVFVVFLLVLFLRPQGLLGRAQT